MKKLLTLLSMTAAIASANIALASEAGKMYFKADIGVGVIKNKLNTKFGADVTSTNPAYFFKSGTAYEPKETTSAKPFLGSISFGYYTADEVRTDLTLFLAPNIKNEQTIVGKADSRASAADVNVKLNTKSAQYALMGNVYYDFNTGSGITPYVTAGIGIAHASTEIDDKNLLSLLATKTFVDTPADLKDLKTKGKYAFAYSIGAGVAFEVSNGAFLDIGYLARRTTGKNQLELTKAATTNPAAAAVTSTLEVKSPIMHTATIGFRMSF